MEFCLFSNNQLASFEMILPLKMAGGSAPPYDCNMWLSNGSFRKVAGKIQQAEIKCNICNSIVLSNLVSADDVVAVGMPPLMAHGDKRYALQCEACSTCYTISKNRAWELIP